MTLRSTWNGSIAFGLVNVPVKLYKATEDNDVKFHMTHHNCAGSRINFKRICTACATEVPYGDIDKMWDRGLKEDPNPVIVTEAELAGLPQNAKRELTVDAFVPWDQIDPVWIENSYWCGPDIDPKKKENADGYALLREVLERTGRAGVVRLTISKRPRLAVIGPKDGALMVHTLQWADELRPVTQVPNLDRVPKLADVRGVEKVLPMALALVDSITEDWHHDEIKDSYRAAVLELLNARANGENSPTAKDEEDEEVSSLMAALQASVRRAS